MEIQTHLKKRVLSNYRLRGFYLVGLMAFCGLPSQGEPEKEGSPVEIRKAQRHHPVAFRAAANRPITHRAAPLGDRFEGIPRAKVVRAVPPAKVPQQGVTRPVSVKKHSPSRTVEPALQPSQPTSKVATSVPPVPKSSKSDRRVEGATPAPRREASNFPASPSPATLVRRCDVMALQGLEYKFGAVDPASGGLDCSSTVQYLLRQEGIKDCPRTAYTQYMWLKKSGTLNKVSRWTWSADRVAKKLRAGDLLFWTGTYNTGNSPNISHVMIYLGRDASNGKQYMFGASSRRSKGLHGNGVDVYEFVYPRKHGKDNFAGFGSVPGLRR